MAKKAVLELPGSQKLISRKICEIEKCLCLIFAVAQILLEINFEEFRNSKTAIFANSKALNLVDLLKFCGFEYVKMLKMKLLGLKHLTKLNSRKESTFITAVLNI